MTDWNACQYLRFEDERTRPSRDLLVRVALTQPRLIFDLGCGPGNSTELLVEHYPDAEVVGIEFIAGHASAGARAASRMHLRPR